MESCFVEWSFSSFAYMIQLSIELSIGIQRRQGVGNETSFTTLLATLFGNIKTFVKLACITCHTFVKHVTHQTF
jgi:hypothetical protein